MCSEHIIIYTWGNYIISWKGKEKKIFFLCLFIWGHTIGKSHSNSENATIN